MLVDHMMEGARLISFCPVLQTRYFAIIISCILHLALRTTVFIHQEKGDNMETPTIATYIVYLSMMDLIYSDDLLPCKLRGLPKMVRFFMELLATLFLGEVCLIFFWANIEKICLNLLNSYVDVNEETRATIHYLLLIVLSMFLCWLVGLETERNEKISNLIDIARDIKVEREMINWAYRHPRTFHWNYKDD